MGLAVGGRESHHGHATRHGGACQRVQGVDGWRWSTRHATRPGVLARSRGPIAARQRLGKVRGGDRWRATGTVRVHKAGRDWRVRRVPVNRRLDQPARSADAIRKNSEPLDSPAERPA
jgi:hypothetical protein